MFALPRHPMDFSSNDCWLTPSALNTTQRWAAYGLVPRSVGAFGVSSAALIDATGHLGLCVTTTFYAIITGTCEIVAAPFGYNRRVNPLGLRYATREHAFIHLRQAVNHVGIATINPVLAVVSPSQLQIPVLVSLGMQPRRYKQEDSTEEAVLISLFFAGAIGGGLYLAHQHGLIDLSNLPNLPNLPDLSSLTDLVTWFKPEPVPVPVPVPGISASQVALSIVALATIAFAGGGCQVPSARRSPVAQAWPMEDMEYVPPPAGGAPGVQWRYEEPPAYAENAQPQHYIPVAIPVAPSLNAYPEAWYL